MIKIKIKLKLTVISCIFSLLLNTSCNSSSRSNDLLDTLNNMKISEDCNSPKYSRRTWRHWTRNKKTGYDTRQAVLIKSSRIKPIFDTKTKKVAKGEWYDPYTNQIFILPSNLDIDHLVPLGEAHKSGACKWSKEKKKHYANYLKHSEELIAVSKKANRAKGQKDPAKWLPENENYRCEYITTWLTIKNRWQLWIDIEEKKAITKVIKKYCKDS